MKDPSNPPISGGEYSYIVKITYVDGSVDYAAASFSYTNYDSQGLYLDFVYSGERYVNVGQEYVGNPSFWTPGMTGEEVGTPDGATFEITNVSNENIQATIDSTTGKLTYKIVAGQDGDKGSITVHVHYSDGSTADYSIDLTVGEDPDGENTTTVDISVDVSADDLEEMWYRDNQVPVVAGEDLLLSPVFYIPVLTSSDSIEIPGASYDLVDASSEMNARIDPETGEVTVKFDQIPAEDTIYNFTVRVTFADGTTHEQTFEYTLAGTGKSPTEL